WLIFDIDEPFQGEYAWERHNLPVPNYIAFSRDSRKYHMSYAISPVCTTENAREKPLAYLAAIHRTYKRLLNSDAGFAHLITKTLCIVIGLLRSFMIMSIRLRSCMMDVEI
ncbi:replication initiation protein, partial [Vibrio parahaemolyticus]|nr:replication initiation protein [Vibrio parahaemolyticus]MCF9925080.1 replication initiation protein [Vibrio parahaemolyticus]